MRNFKQTTRQAEMVTVPAPALPRTRSSIGVSPQPPSWHESHYKYFTKTWKKCCSKIPLWLVLAPAGQAVDILVCRRGRAFWVLGGSFGQKKKRTKMPSSFYCSHFMNLPQRSPQVSHHIVNQLLSKQRLVQSGASCTTSSIASIDGFHTAFI